MRCVLLLLLFTRVISGASLNQTDSTEYADNCRENIVIHTATYVASMGYPFSYMPSQQCVWVLTAPEPGQKLLITFGVYFELQDRDCKHDYLEVYNGGDELSPLLGRFCGTATPPPIISSGNQLLFKFVTDDKIEEGGFFLAYEIYKTGPECSRNFTAPTGVIKTPGFPEKYPHNMKCIFMIFAQNKSEIVVDFDSFDMEPDYMLMPVSSCKKDWLDIWDGFPEVGSHIGRYCSQISPGRVTSSTGVLSMTVTTDKNIARQGFSANYTITDKCRNNIVTHTVGYLSSAGYPISYLPSQQCVWVLTTPEPGQKLLITFNSYFELQDGDCKHDYLEVYNGGDELSPLLGRFCGTAKPPPIISSGNQLLAKFVTDDKIEEGGFFLTYEIYKTGPECSRNFTAPTGVIKTPGFPDEYPHNMKCIFMIFAQNKSEIVVDFDSFDMEPDYRLTPVSSCQNDWLDIWDGFPEVGSHIGRYCSPRSPGRVTSSTGVLSMTVTTDKNIARQGFSANYTNTDKCRENIVTHTASYLASAGYPISYLPSQQCVWVLTTPEPGQKLLITFNSYFELQDGDCKHDYLEVYNGGDELSPLLGRFCGTAAPPPIISSGNQLLFKFVTDDKIEEGGFSLTYEIYKTGPECSRNFTAPTGVIKTPGFPEKYPHNMKCIFMIFAQNKSEIVVDFDSFDMEPDYMLMPVSSCQNDWLDIWDGFPEVGSHIGRYCSQTSPGRVTSSTGVLSMTVTTDKNIAGKGFSANYTITDKCRENIVIHTATYVASMGYPFSYMPSQQCVWVLTAPEPGQKLLITFGVYFELQDRDCKHDYLEVYNGGDELSPLLGRFCGTATPPPIISSGNQLLFKFVTDDKIEEGGFFLAYEIYKTGPECSRNFTAPTGVIKTPGFPEKYPHNMKCIFMIFAQNKSEIVVDFDSFDMEPDYTLMPVSSCKKDWLDIWDGFPEVGSHIGRYCSQTSPGRVTSSTGVLSMTVTTDKNIAGKGFSANYTISERSLSSL